MRAPPATEAIALRARALAHAVSQGGAVGLVGTAYPGLASWRLPIPILPSLGDRSTDSNKQARLVEDNHVCSILETILLPILGSPKLLHWLRMGPNMFLHDQWVPFKPGLSQQDAWLGVK